jgi:hypothetical protein
MLTSNREAQAMPNQPTLAHIFQPEPAQWGLRGDPYLWREMRERLGAHPCPATEEQLALLLEQTYQQLTGAALSDPGPIFVERLCHGSMSSGYVSGQFWAEHALPLLRARYRQPR